MLESWKKVSSSLDMLSVRAETSSKGYFSITQCRRGFGREVRRWGYMSFVVISPRTVG